LLYKLQRHVKSGGQRNMKTLKVNKNKAKCVQMLAAWKVEDSKLFVLLVLIEHTKEFTWARDKLKKLYYENCRWLKRYVNTTLDIWSIDDDMVLRTTFRVRGTEGNFELSILISEGKNDGYAMRPIWINTER
jgi:hypothetical protein